MATDTQLPPPGQDQAYCNVSALEGGLLQLDKSMFVAGVPREIATTPSLAFLIRHSTRPTTVLFDLGVRRDIDNYPPASRQRAREVFQARVDKDVPASLARGRLAPPDIDVVALSHVHWDHIGDPRAFTRAQFVVGVGSKRLFAPGYPADAQSGFAADLLPEGRTTFLDPDDWAPIGPFPRTLDYFGDGSLYIVDAPGHLPGHINVLARTSVDGGWVFLAGDSAHHWGLVTGGGEIALGYRGNPHACAHADRAAAEAHIARIRALFGLPRVRVLLAHDEPWYRENEGGPAFWPGKIESL